MQQFTSEYQAELEKGRTDPTVLVDGYEFYSPDYIPDPILGFDPADAIERFAGQELTWNGFAYRREVISRGDITLNIGEKTNSVSIQFSNISRYLSAFAQSQTIEGMLLCIRCIAPAVTNDSKAMFHGRCDKPGDIDKKSFPLTARQDFGNLNQQAPPSKFTADDPNGRLPGDDLYEGIPFIQVGGSYQYPFVRQTNGFGGRIFGRRTTDTRTEQFSSLDLTPYGSPIREVFGRCQIELRPFISIDKGVFIAALWEACKGPIAAITNIRTLVEGLTDPINSFENPPDPAIVHLGDPGGTGTNQGNTGQADLGGGSKFSHLAYVEGAIAPIEVLTNATISDPNILNELPPVSALILGRIVPLPDGSGDYVLEGWTDNPVHIARFILTHPQFVNIDPGFMEDEINYLTSLHCDEPILDESESQLIPIATADLPQAGDSFTRYRSTGLITPRSILFDLGDDSVIPELEDGPYLPVPPTGGPDDVFCPIGFHHDPDTGTCVANVSAINATQGLLRKRYTANFPITEDIRCVDLFHKIILAAFRGYLKVTGKGRLAICTEKSSSATRLRSATAVGATSIPVLDVTPWKSGPELLQGRIVISGGQIHSEARTVTSADYSTSGNSITLTASDTGGVTATASGATLSGGSTSVQASGTVTLTGTPDGTVTITIDGVSVAYILSPTDTLITAAAMLTAHINATRRLRQYIFAEWSGAVITIKCLHGALNVGVPFLKVHGGPIANPTTAPTVAAAASGALQAGTYQVGYADVNANGLTALTLLATVALTADQKINVSSLPAFPAGVTQRQFFVSEKPNSTRLRYQATRTDAANFSINALPLPNAAQAPSQNTTAEELIRVAMSLATNSQDVFPARQPLTAVVLNDIYLPDPLNGHKYQATSITTGITGSGTPTWPTTVGGTVVDGGVTWTEIGSTVLQQAGLTRANILKDTYSWPKNMQSSVNVVEIPFRDAKNDFALTTLRIHDEAHQLQVKKKLPLKIDGSAIDNYNQAWRIGNGELSKNREGDWFNALGTGPAALVLEEGDLICASDDSGGHVNVITRIEELRIAKDHTVTITKARKYSTAMFSDDVGSHVIPIASTLRYVQTLDSIAEFIDTPAIHEADFGRAGFYVSVTRDLALDGDWRGFEVYVDYGDGYGLIGAGDVAATIGESTDTLASVADITVLDETNDLGVTFDYVAASAPFTSCSEADLLANPFRNLFLVKETPTASGGEFIQAATIVDNGNRSFTLSDILHGRFETTCVSHAIGERVIYMDGAEVFIPTDPSRIGIEYNYKFVTTNQDVADATAVPFTWLGNNLRPAAPTDLDAERDSSKDWYASGIGHPTLAEMPANYVMRFRRASDDEFLRDVPTWHGVRMAALLTEVPVQADPGFLTLSNNNISDSRDNSFWHYAYAVQPLGPSVEIAGLVVITLNGAGSGGVRVNLGATLANVYSVSNLASMEVFTNDSSSVAVAIYDWSGAQQDLLTIPSVDSNLYFRIVISGTEVRFQVSGSPISPTAAPNAILRDIPDRPDPNYLIIGTLVPSSGTTEVRNITMSGLERVGVIYSLGQQEQDLLTAGESAPTAALGIDVGDLDVEMWQTSPIAGIQGRSVRGVF